MPIIKLTAPEEITPEQHARFKRVGLVFGGETSKGFTEVEGDLSTHSASETLSHLSMQELNSLIPLFPKSVLKPGLDRAIELHDLRLMMMRNVDGFPFPTEDRPFAWKSTHHLIFAEVERLHVQLQVLGISQTRVGMELEFALPNEPIAGFDQWQNVRHEILNEITQQIGSAFSQEYTRLSEKKAAVEKFNAREILMFDLIERDERTKDILEPLFGTSLDGLGYYDAEGTLELKISHGDIRQLSAKRRIVIETLYEKAISFGLLLMGEVSQQASFSFWSDGKNLLDHTHSAFVTTGKSIIEGVVRVMYDALPLLVEDYMLDKAIEPKHFSLTVDRENLLRMATGRLEVRFQNCSIYQDIDLALPIVMAGALFGLNPKDGTYFNEHVVKATLRQNGTFHHQPDQFKLTAHVLGNSIINSNGSLNLPETYIKTKSAVIGFEMGIERTRPQSHAFFSYMPSYAQQIVEFFKQVRVRLEENGYTIVWPKTEKNTYTIETPGFNMERFPLELQEKLIREGSLANEELGRYLTVGEMVLPPKKYVIDITKLELGIKLVDVSAKYVVSPGYNANDVSANILNALQLARAQRFMTSVPLSENLSQALKEAIVLAVKEKFVPESLQQPVASIVPSQSLSPHISSIFLKMPKIGTLSNESKEMVEISQTSVAANSDKKPRLI